MGQLLVTSLIISLIILLVLLHKKFMGDKLASRTYYIIWILLTIRLILPFNLAIKTPVYEFASRPGLINYIGEDGDFLPQGKGLGGEGIVIANEDMGLGQEVKESRHIQASQARPHISYENIFSLWLLGFTMYFLYHMTVYLVFKRRIKRTLTQPDGGIEESFRSIKDRLGISRQVLIRESQEVDSPLLMGIFNPILVIPNNISHKGIDYIIAHELVHLKRRDLLYKFLVFLARAIHWFNPIIHLMGQISSRDLELSCDEELVKNMGKDERASYCRVLLDSISTGGREVILITNYSGGKKTMKKRIDNILDNINKGTGKVFILALLSLLLGSVFLIGCQSKDKMDMDSMISAGLKGPDLKEEYYLQLKTKQFNGDELMDEADIEEWYRYSPEEGYNRKIVAHSNKESNVIISSNNGFIMHDLNNNRAEVFDKEKASKEMVESMQGLEMKTSKHNTAKYLQDLSEDFNLKLAGEEKINGLNALHIVCEPKQMEDILGQEELWIEEDSWIILKQIKRKNNMTVETNLIELELNKELDSETFEYEIPDGVDIYNLGT